MDFKQQISSQNLKDYLRKTLVKVQTAPPSHQCIASSEPQTPPLCVHLELIQFKVNTNGTKHASNFPKIDLEIGGL